VVIHMRRAPRFGYAVIPHVAPMAATNDVAAAAFKESGFPGPGCGLDGIARCNDCRDLRRRAPAAIESILRVMCPDSSRNERRSAQTSVLSTVST